jgi:pimeloyl-ACP methyl ester carboxylesterase
VLAVTPDVLPRALVKMSLAPAYADRAHLTPDRVTRYWAMMRAPGVRQAMLARLHQTVLINPRPILAKVSAPTLLLWGAKDGMIPVSNAQDYLRTMPSATLVEMPDLGHVPMEEDPARSLAPVVAFLAKPNA